MDLKQLAAKPKLSKVTVDTELVVEAYGEPVEFYMYDRQDLPLYMKLIQLKEDESELWHLVKSIVLDAEGRRVLEDGEILPVDIMVPVIEAAVKHLGNQTPLTSQQ